MLGVLRVPLVRAVAVAPFVPVSAVAVVTVPALAVLMIVMAAMAVMAAVMSVVVQSFSCSYHYVTIYRNTACQRQIDSAAAGGSIEVRERA